MIDRLTRRLSWFLVGAAALFAGLYAARPITTWDFWWHVRSGQEIIEERSIPEFDSFSHTAGDRLWVNHEWLFDVILYPVWGRLGAHPIRIACGLILIGTVLLAARIAYRWTRSAPLTALLTLAFLGLYFGNIHVRPQILSYPFFLWIFDRFFFRKDPPGWPLLAAGAAVMIFWANVHAVALLPVLFYVAWLVAESLSGPLSGRLPFLAAPPEDRLPWRGHLLPFAVLFACTFASPNTWRLHQYALAGSSFASTFVTEWSPFYFRFSENRNLPIEIYLTVIASLALGILWLLAHAIRRRRLDGAEVTVIASCFYFVLTGRRWLWMALIPLAIVLREGGPLRGLLARGRSPGRQALALVLTVTLSAGLSSPFRRFLPVRQAWETLRDGRYFSLYINPVLVPNDAASVLREAGVRGNLFNFYGWGGFLLYTLYPECRVFVDGRAVLFPPEVIRDMGTIGHHLDGAPALLDRYRVEMTVMPEPWKPPESRPGVWIPFFRGAREAVWGRAGSENSSRMAAYYAGLGIPFEPSEGFVPAAAAEANPQWARRRNVLDPDLLQAQEPLYEALRSGVRDSREEVALRGRLAEAYLGAGRAESAARELRLAHALDPRDPFTVLNLANLEMRLGRRDRARRILEEYLAAAPDDRQARALLDRLDRSP